MTIGKLAEEQACDFLRKQGLVLKQKNYRIRIGEIDLIMEDKGTLVFVEVKYRSTDRWGTPLEAVTPQKQRRIRAVARYYMASCTVERHCRFDVVGMAGRKIHWIKGAF